MARKTASHIWLLTFLLFILLVEYVNASPFFPGRASVTQAPAPLLRKDPEAVDDAPQSVILTTSCVYPISGTYTRFQRILFYVVVVVVFFLRFHKWILAAGAAWLGAYTFSTAIHAIALGITAGSGVDADILAVTIICQAGFSAAFIFAMWPSKHFHRSSSPILIFWTFFLLCAKFFPAWGFEKWYRSRLILDIDLGPGFQEPSPKDMWQACASACATVALDRYVMFRTPADELVPYTCEILASATNSREHQNDARELSPAAVSVADSLQDDYSFFNSLPAAEIALIIAIGFLITSTTISADIPPRVCRNWIYRRLTSSDPPRSRLKTPRYILCVAITFLCYVWQVLLVFVFPLMAVDILVSFIITKATKGRGVTGVWRLRTPENKPAGTPSTAKRRFAMTMALTWYAWATVGYFAFPAYMAHNIYQLELIADFLPEQEAPMAIGQWSTWVSAGLALLLAVYTRLRPDRNGAARQHDSILLNDIDTQRRTDERMRRLVVRDPPEWLLRRPQLCSYYTTLSLNWADLKLWWKDPTRASWLEDPANTTRRCMWCRTKYSRESMEDYTDVEEDFVDPLQKLDWKPSSSADSASDSGSRFSDLGSGRLADAWSIPPTSCSRVAYARYLPCACSDCKGKEPTVVVYSSEEDNKRTRTEALDCVTPQMSTEIAEHDEWSVDEEGKHRLVYSWFTYFRAGTHYVR